MELEHRQYRTVQYMMWYGIKSRYYSTVQYTTLCARELERRQYNTFCCMELECRQYRTVQYMMWYGIRAQTVQYMM